MTFMITCGTMTFPECPEPGKLPVPILTYHDLTYPNRGAQKSLLNIAGDFPPECGALINRAFSQH